MHLARALWNQRPMTGWEAGEAWDIWQAAWQASWHHRRKCLGDVESFSVTGSVLQYGLSFLAREHFGHFRFNCFLLFYMAMALQFCLHLIKACRQGLLRLARGKHHGMLPLDFFKQMHQLLRDPVAAVGQIRQALLHLMQLMADFTLAGLHLSYWKSRACCFNLLCQGLGQLVPLHQRGLVHLAHLLDLLNNWKEPHGQVFHKAGKLLLNALLPN
mmetsp:Transcript_73133/g.120633  ORF Transcript_73133/g.120633 Transcript_73133/m.120633 type:complete len:215 (+) Transcript_73133:246-890(+)